MMRCAGDDHVQEIIMCMKRGDASLRLSTSKQFDPFPRTLHISDVAATLVPILSFADKWAVHQVHPDIIREVA